MMIKTPTLAASVFLLLSEGIHSDQFDQIVSDARRRGIDFNRGSRDDWLRTSRFGSRIALTRKLRLAVWVVQNTHDTTAYCQNMANWFDSAKRSGFQERPSSLHGTPEFDYEGAILSQQERRFPEFYS